MHFLSYQRIHLNILKRPIIFLHQLVSSFNPYTNDNNTQDYSILYQLTQDKQITFEFNGT